MASTTISYGPSTVCAHTVQDVINTILTAERVMAAFYYTGLTSRDVMRDHALSGPSADPNNPGLPPGGNPTNVRYLQAALDAEVKHAAALVDAGAVSPHAHVYFPVDTFQRLGTSGDHNGFLGMMDMLEALCEGLYIAAVQEFLRLGQLTLAATAAEIMGVECEHRTLGRSIANVSPPNDQVLIAAPFGCIGDLDTALGPYLVGKGVHFTQGAPRAVAIPSAAQTAHVIGRYGTRRVRQFLFRKGGQ